MLVGLDGSPDSAVALRWADGFARKTGRDLHLACAWEHDSWPRRDSLPEIRDAASVEHDVESRLREVAAEHLDAASGQDVVVGALRGPVAEALLDHADSSGADLLVVGASGRGGAARALLGSISRRLTECPSHVVAVVPDTIGDDVSPGPIVVGVDGSAGSSRALRWAGEGARRSGVEVVVAHAVESPVPEPTREELDATLAEARRRVEEEWCAPLVRLGVEHRAVVERGEPRDVVMGVARRVEPWCVVVGSRGLGPITQRLLGSLTHHLVRRAEWPVVVVPAPRDRVIWQA